MITEAIIVALLSLVGTLVGTYGGIRQANKLTAYRIQKLEDKVDKHNRVIERTYKLEENLSAFHNEFDTFKDYVEKIV